MPIIGVAHIGDDVEAAVKKLLAAPGVESESTAAETTTVVPVDIFRDTVAEILSETQQSLVAFEAMLKAQYDQRELELTEKVDAHMHEVLSERQQALRGAFENRLMAAASNIKEAYRRSLEKLRRRHRDLLVKLEAKTMETWNADSKGHIRDVGILRGQLSALEEMFMQEHALNEELRKLCNLTQVCTQVDVALERGIGIAKASKILEDEVSRAGEEPFLALLTDVVRERALEKPKSYYDLKKSFEGEVFPKVWRTLFVPQGWAGSRLGMLVGTTFAGLYRPGAPPPLPLNETDRISSLKKVVTVEESKRLVSSGDLYAAALLLAELEGQSESVVRDWISDVRSTTVLIGTLKAIHAHLQCRLMGCGNKFSTTQQDLPNL